MLVIHNGTEDVLHAGLDDCSAHTRVDPYYSCRLTLPSTSKRSKRRLRLLVLENWAVNVNATGSKHGWKELGDKMDWPWRVYRVQCDTEIRILVLPKRDMSCFLRDLDDNLPLSSIMLPGTHQTMALYGWPHSKCQDSSLTVQLKQGIRVLDIRLSLVDGKLLAYHGVWPEQATFSEIIASTLSFLDSPEGQSETVVMSVKPEDNSPWFNQEVWLHIESSRHRWLLDNRIPTLGEARGKIVLFSRFGGHGWPEGIGLGIHPPTWPDSVQVGFEWWLRGTRIYTQDWYRIPSFIAIPEKVSVATSTLLVPRDAGPTLNISFFSASSLLLALPPTVALGIGWPDYGLGFRGVNERVAMWLLNMLSSKDAEDIRLRGWALLDFFDTPKNGIAVLPQLLAEFNWRGRTPGEEGWPIK